MPEQPRPVRVASLGHAARTFLYDVVHTLGWRVPAAAGIAVCLACSEGVGIILLVPLLQSIGLTTDDGTANRLSWLVSQAFGAAGIAPSLPAVLLAFLFVSAAHAALYRSNVIIQPALEQRFSNALRSRLYQGIVHARWSFHIRRRSNDLVHALTTEVDRAGAAVHHTMALFSGLLVSAIYVLAAIRLSPELTVLVFLGGAGLVWRLRRRADRTAEMGRRYSAATKEQLRVASDSIGGIKVAKTFGAENRSIEAFANGTHDRADAYLQLTSALARWKMWLDVASAVLVTVLLLVAVQWLGLRGIGLLVLIFVFVRIVPRILTLQDTVHMLAAALPSYEAVTGLIAECEASSERSDEPSGDIRTFRDIRLEAVDFGYAPDLPLVLRRVSLTLAPGGITAIVGPSGAGKTTLADILLGLLQPTRGRILVDGNALGDMKAWRRSIGYVPQDGFLLNDTVRANLAWAVPDAPDDKMWTALEGAGATFVRERPEGLDTPIGERGVSLSGGERQRIALARALLTSPSLLVLDEATSALDSVSEQRILQTIQRLRGRVSTVLITHRLSAVRDADVINVLEEGSIVEAGRWHELIARGGAFARLRAAQRDSSRETDLVKAQVRG